MSNVNEMSDCKFLNLFQGWKASEITCGHDEIYSKIFQLEGIWFNFYRVSSLSIHLDDFY